MTGGSFVGEDVGLGTGQGAHPGVRVGAAALARRGPFGRYTVSARLHDALPVEWSVYDAGRVAGISALLLRPGALVLDIGCGTGLNFPLIHQAIGSTGRIVGVDASTDMLAQARAKAERRGWANIDLVPADATTLTPARLRERPDQDRDPDGAEAVLFTYSLSVMTDWPGAWRAGTAAARPGAGVAVVDMRTPTGPATALAPLARLACLLGGSDITAHPWTALEQECTDVQAWSLRGGHIQVRAGPIASRGARHSPPPATATVSHRHNWPRAPHPNRPRRSMNTTVSSDRPINTDGARLPAVILFDVNETLSDMSPIGQRFVDVGAPAHLAATWFAALLRDGFALTAAGSTASFGQLGVGVLRASLGGLPLNRTVDEAIEYIMGGFDELSVHHDVRDGIPALAALDTRLVTLSNGAVTVAQRLFERAGIGEPFERLLSVEDAGVWKPAPGAYAYAARQCGVEPIDMMLVAVHPWDIDGAHRAGLGTAWINRTGATYPDYFTAPTLEATSISHLAQLLRK